MIGRKQNKVKIYDNYNAIIVKIFNFGDFNIS